MPSLAQGREEIWFAPADSLPRGTKQLDQDFPKLFDEPPAWKTDIDVFPIAPYFAERASDEDLLHISHFLNRHHIALAVAVQPMQIENECAPGEGRTRRGSNLRIFHRLRKLNLEIKYVALDEPLTFGHYFKLGAEECRLPIADVARRVAMTITEIRESYPNVRVVDYEAATSAPVESWPKELAEWIEAYRMAAGNSLDAVVFDVNWRRPWLDWVRPSIEVLHRARVRAGMFLTITGPGKSDADAAASLRRNIEAVKEAHLPLDLTILACWQMYPSHSLPPSDANTLTSVLNWYLSESKRSRTP